MKKTGKILHTLWTFLPLSIFHSSLRHSFTSDARKYPRELHGIMMQLFRLGDGRSNLRRDILRYSDSGELTFSPCVVGNSTVGGISSDVESIRETVTESVRKIYRRLSEKLSKKLLKK